MLPVNIRHPLIVSAITVCLGLSHVLVTSGAAQAQTKSPAPAPAKKQTPVPAPSQEIDCAIAKQIAFRAYDRAFAAVKDGMGDRAIAIKQSFWDIEEYSGHCPSIRVLAKALTDNGLGKEVGFPPPSPAGPSSLGSATASSAGPNSTVVAIEVIPRQAAGAGSMAGAAVGDSSTGSSGSGATGSSTAADRVYRITLRMDDGSTRVVTQETTPSFRSGDRINLSGGVIQH